MDLGMRSAYVDFDRDATIDASALSDLTYVSKGGFALVFLANYRRSNGVIQPVAVKVLKPENHFRPANYHKFLQEVAVHTALSHPCIVRSLGFCSVPAAAILNAAPASVLLPKPRPGGGRGGTQASKPANPHEWFAKRHLTKCWALVLELMPDGNMFDQVRAAVAAASEPRRSASPRPTGGGASHLAAALGGAGGSGCCYSDAEALMWLIDIADAMTFVHSRQPLLIHRDLKLENILMRREADGRLHAKLSDFGLTVAVDGAGQKIPPPQVLCAPGQTVQDVVAAAASPRGRTKGASVPQTMQQNKLGAAPTAMMQQQVLVMGVTAPGGAVRGGAGAGPVGVNGRVLPQSCSQVPHFALAATPGAKSPQRHHAPGNGAAKSNCRSPVAAGGGGRGGGGGGGREGECILPSELRPQRSVRSWTSGGRGPSSAALLGLAAEDGGIAGQHSGVSPLGSARMSPIISSPQATAKGPAATAAGTQGGSRGMQQAPGLLSQPQVGGDFSSVTASAAARLSETGHLQVKIDQLNEVCRQGKGHKEYLPDMYQVNFKLTSQCGSVCYMAPEVARQLPYNQKADVFSFGCLLFEVITRQLLSDGLVDGDVDGAMEYISRVSWSGWRPELPTWLRKDLRLLISLSWHREPRLRPSFPTIAGRLREVLYSMVAPVAPLMMGNLGTSACEPMDAAQQQQHRHELQQLQQLQLQLQVLAAQTDQLKQQAALQQQLQELEQQQLQIQQLQLQKELLLQLQKQKQQQQLQRQVKELQLQEQQRQMLQAQQHQVHQFLQAQQPQRLSLNSALQQCGMQQHPTSPLSNGLASPVGASHLGHLPSTEQQHPPYYAQPQRPSPEPTPTKQNHRHQQQLQLQLQLQELNACTRRTTYAGGGGGGGGGQPAPSACNSRGQLGTGLISSAGVHAASSPVFPAPRESVSGVQSILATACTATSGYTTGCRASSPVLGGGGGGAAAQGASRSTATTFAGAPMNGEYGDGADGMSLPSPGGARGSGRFESSLVGVAGMSVGGRGPSATAGRVSRSDGSTASGLRGTQLSQQQQQQELKRLQSGQRQGCMAMCVVM